MLAVANHYSKNIPHTRYLSSIIHRLRFVQMFHDILKITPKHTAYPIQYSQVHRFIPTYLRHGVRSDLCSSLQFYMTHFPIYQHFP